MKQNLDTLKSEILEYLEGEGFVVFHGLSHAGEHGPSVYWDVNRYPDFRLFLNAARGAGAKLINFGHREFSEEAVDEAVDRLEECDVPPDDRRPIERRLREMRMYQGFTCGIELSFDREGRTYVYDLHTEWFAEFLDTLDEIDSYMPSEGEEDEEGPIGGYFSRN